MTVSLVHGASTATFLAEDVTLLEEAISFYTNIIGFSYHSSDGLYTYLSSSNGSMVVKLSIDSKARSRKEIKERLAIVDAEVMKSDLRSLDSSFIFSVSNLVDLSEKLVSFQRNIQMYPNELYPEEVYTIDPLGNIVGFSLSGNPMSLTQKPQKSFASKTITSSTLMSQSVSAKEYSSTPAKRRNIGIMTSGGDSPGMNAVVYAVVRAAIFRGCKPFAVMEGYEGLIRGGPEYIKEMKWQDVRTYLSEGGTNIGTARSLEFRERPGRLKACKNLIEAGVDALIVCGGDGSLTGADIFRAEWPSLMKELLDNGKISKEQFHTYEHLNICGLVGSIDNDMATTDATIGAYSSLARICQAVDYIDATANSHSRAFVIEVMGRHCGWLALMAGVATSADYILIPEKPSSSKDWKDQMGQIVSKHRARGKRKTIVIVAEGAITSDLQPITSNDVKDALVALGLDTRVTTLGHVQRGGTAVAFDRILGTLQGVEAVKAVLDCTPETPSPLIGIHENKIVRKPLVEAVAATKSVAEAIEKKEFAKAMSLRDTEFIEHMSNFMAINSADHNEPTLPKDKRKKIAIINVGAPAGGMNSAVYSMATYCMSRGHIPYAIHNGFGGLSRHESVRSIKWLDIEGWNSIGGSEIGTNRETPEESDIGMIAYYFEKYNFDGLILVGGFEAFVSLNQLEKARLMFPAFRIPMVLIPATISNNVPGTEYSLGADTCLNSLMEYCDVIKQSASSTRNRTFVVEVQGGNSGYIATFAALTCGAQISYVPEEGIPLDQLNSDINSLKEAFANEKNLSDAGKLILKSLNASNVLTTKVLADIFAVESNGEFDVKTAIPGHVQQGGLPSPIDRTRASKFAVRAVQFIEDNCDIISRYRTTPAFPIEDKSVSATASVLGVKSSHLKFTSIRGLYNFETELVRRMPKKIHWNSVRDISDQLVGRCRILRQS